MKPRPSGPRSFANARKIAIFKIHKSATPCLTLIYK